MKKLYAYGMRLRGFSPGCQPMGGLVKHMDYSDDFNGRFYYDILVYDRQLTEKEIRDYDLEEIKVHELSAGRES